MRVIRMRWSLALLFACAAASCSPIPHSVAYNGSLWIDGRQTALAAAEFHYWQLPAPSLWRDVFRRIRADGYNAVAIDLYWGYHSPRPGAYDFTGVRDLDALFDDAQREDLYVIVQSGPYIDDGADASGLPDWILARTAPPKELAARYDRQSREWFEQIDAIIVRHQLTNGSGTVVLDELSDRDAHRVAVLERSVRADGVTVPFSTQAYTEAHKGIRWGWSSDPQESEDASGSVGWHPASLQITLPAITGWRSHTDDNEIHAAFEDQAWPPLLNAGTFDRDDYIGAVQPVGLSLKHARFFGVDDYGFHHGAVWYRGHFAATGAERSLVLRGIAGRTGACGAWLNGRYLGSAAADNSGFIGAEFSFTAAMLRRHRDNVISVLFEDAGHSQDFNRDSTRAQPRGMLQAALTGSSAGIAWRMLGNGEYNTDPARGPLNTGGLAGEIAGWQNLSFSDSAWTSTKLPASVRRPGVTWYRARVKLDVTLPAGAFIALRVDDLPAAQYHASIFCNGWLMGRAIGSSRTHIVPLPTGIVDIHGGNTIAIALWSLNGRGGLGNVSLTTVRAFTDAHPTFSEPPVVRERDRVARLNLSVEAGKALEPHFLYNGAIASPTIRVRPGDAIAVNLRNDLPRATTAPDAINLHFHGLDVAPVKPGDEVLMTIARPGQNLRYRVNIPVTQPPGLYWYHPHSHGETYWQVTSGMSGAIVVEGLEARVAALRAMRERIIIVRDVQNVPNILTIPWYARKMTDKSYAVDPDDSPGANGACLPEVGLHLTLNGLVEPDIPIASGEQQLFRVLNAAASRVLDLAVDNERIGLVAIDGYPVASYPGNPAIVWASHIVVPPAGRAEFIVTGQSTPAVLRSRCYDSGSAGDRDPEAVLATLTGSRVELVGSARPSRALSEASAEVPTIGFARSAIRRKIFLTEDASGFYINGHAFSMDAAPTVIARAGTLEEWTLFNYTDETHDIHIHQVHFVVESIDGKGVEPKLWRDTVLVPVRHRKGRTWYPGTARILVDFRNPSIRGVFVFHCHMLDHEDGGMMALIRVV